MTTMPCRLGESGFQASGTCEEQENSRREFRRHVYLSKAPAARSILLKRHCLPAKARKHNILCLCVCACTSLFVNAQMQQLWLQFCVSYPVPKLKCLISFRIVTNPNVSDSGCSHKEFYNQIGPFPHLIGHHNLRIVNRNKSFPQQILLEPYFASDVTPHLRKRSGCATGGTVRLPKHRIWRDMRMGGTYKCHRCISICRFCYTSK